MGCLLFFGKGGKMCIANSEKKQTEQVSEIASPTNTVSLTTTEISQSVQQNKIKELEDKINSFPCESLVNSCDGRKGTGLT